MLGWFKKKFSKKEETVKDEADLKIPVAPRVPIADRDTASPVPPAPEPSEDKNVDIEATIPDEATQAAVPEDAHPEPAPTEDDHRELKEPAGAAPEPSPAHVVDIDPDEAAQETVSSGGEHDQTRPLRSPVDPTPYTFKEHQDTGKIEQIQEASPEPPEPPVDQDEVDASAAREAGDNVEEEFVETITDLHEKGAVPGSEEPEPAPMAKGDTSQKIPVAERRVPVEALQQPEHQPAREKKSFLSRLSERLSRTRESFTYRLDSLFLGKKEIDAELLDDLEELLITADLGLKITQETLDYARRKVKRKELSDPNSLKVVLKEKLASFIAEYQEDATLVMPDKGPFVIMVVGVNGVGKTTTIGKIAHKFLQSDQSVLLVAADTFRAAAVSQLKIWGERNNVPVIAKDEGADPSSVVYDGIAHAKAKGYDVVLVDTAGRLHTQANLMEELKKIKRVMGKQLDGAPHEVMLVIDATTGQNGISQAKLFNEAVKLTGLTLTKLDGTAKGGIVINICKELQLPIRFIGVGEQLNDLRDFDPSEFIEALFTGDSGRPQ